MRLLIKLIIFNFVGATWFESWQKPFLQTVVVRVIPLSCQLELKCSGKEVMKLSVQFFPNYHSLSLSYANNDRYSLKFREQI